MTRKEYVKLYADHAQVFGCPLGVRIRCPLCDSKDKDFSQYKPGVFKCHSCDRGGDIFAFVDFQNGGDGKMSGARFGEVVELTAQLAGVSASGVPTVVPPARVPPKRTGTTKPTVAPEEIAAFYATCVPTSTDAQARESLRARKLDPGKLDEQDLARVMRSAACKNAPPWARSKAGKLRSDSGYGLVSTTHDVDGDEVGSRFRYIGSKVRKVKVYGAIRASGAVLTNPVALRVLKNEQMPEELHAIVGEGETDHFTLAIEYPAAAVFGAVCPSSVQAELIRKLPPTSRITMAVDRDNAKHRDGVVKALRAAQFPGEVYEWGSKKLNGPGAKKPDAPIDVNDHYKLGLPIRLEEHDDGDSFCRRVDPSEYGVAPDAPTVDSPKPESDSARSALNAPMLVHKTSYHLRGRQGEWIGPLTSAELPAVGHEHGYETTKTSKKTGELSVMPSKEILYWNGGVRVAHVVTDMAADTTALLEENGERVLVRTPRFECATLRAFASLVVAELFAALDPTGALAEWCGTASVRAWLDEPMPALLLVGPAEIGKNLIIDALARAHRMRQAHPGDKLFGAFHGTMDTGNVIHAEEQVFQDARGRPMTREFRAAVTSRERVLNQKHVAEVKVRGAIRLGMTANALVALLPDNARLTQDDIHAIKSRVTLIEVDEQQAVRARAIIKRLPVDPRKRLETVAAHMLSLAPLAKPTTGRRMLVVSRPGRLVDVLRRQQSGSDRLAEYVDRATGGGFPVALWSAPNAPGKLHVRVQEFRDAINDHLRASEVTAMKKLLANLCGGTPAQRGKKRRRTLLVDVRKLAELIDVDPGDLIAAAEVGDRVERGRAKLTSVAPPLLYPPEAR